MAVNSKTDSSKIIYLVSKAVFTFIFIASFLLLLNPVQAHPGNTASDGCHYCRTRCDYWGEAWNVRHCHNGYTAPVYKAPKEYIPPAIVYPTWTPRPLPTWTPRPLPTMTPLPTVTPIPTWTLTSTPSINFNQSALEMKKLNFGQFLIELIKRIFGQSWGNFKHFLDLLYIPRNSSWKAWIFSELMS